MTESAAERQAFEAWARKVDMDVHRRRDGEYSFSETEFAWGVWRSARRARPEIARGDITRPREVPSEN